MDALTAMAVVQAAVQSNLTGRAVEIPRLLQAAGAAWESLPPITREGDLR